MSNDVLVTGASGNVGRAVIHALRGRGLGVTAAAHGGGGQIHDCPRVRLDFEDRSTWSDALRGQRHLFLMRPPAISDVAHTLNPFIDAARASGVDHVVFLSVAGAGKSRIVPHRKVEDHLRRSGDHYTNLRPGFFAWTEVADALTSALGREIRYQPASILGYARHLSRRGLPRGAIAVQTILHALLRIGQGAQPTLCLATRCRPLSAVALGRILARRVARCRRCPLE